MEDLNPTLWLLLNVKKSLEQGESIGTSLKKIELQCPEVIKSEFLMWKYNIDKAAALPLDQFVKSNYRTFLYQIFERGLKGDSVYNSLCLLEEEVYQSCRNEVELWIGRLPFLLLIPLMLFQFPALVLITLGPFFQEMLDSMGGQLP